MANVHLPPEKESSLDELAEGELQALALQTRSCIFRDYLAGKITSGFYDYRRFIAALKQDKSKVILRPRLAVLLAKIVASQRLFKSDYENALLVFERLMTLYGESVLVDEDKIVYSDLLDILSRTEKLASGVVSLDIEAYAPGDAAALLANAQIRLAGTGSSAWLQALNELFALDELAPVGIAPGDAPLLDRLESTVAARSVDGPLVTVIVPTWRPGPWLWTAVRSLTQQTYKNLQILIMDDRSGPEFSAELERLLSMDSRISLITSPQNRGTYASRNAAVREYAQGDYVTIQDDDDWSHPQRIERQVRFSQQRKLAVGMCRAARVTEDLRFVRRAATYIRRGYPTTLISRETFAEIGFWDPVRRNSDFEFIRRARSAKKPRGDLGIAPMMLQRHREGSLSSSEVWEGYSEQARRWQNWLASDWHDRSLASGERIYMGSGTCLPRPYPAPIGLIRTGSSEPLSPIDALIVSDYGIDSPYEAATYALAKELLAVGKNIGLLHIETFRPLSHAISGETAELAHREGVSTYSWNDEVSADVVHVMAPMGLALCDMVESKVSADFAVLHDAEKVPHSQVVELFHLKSQERISIAEPKTLRQATQRPRKV
ncbi:glycosyltransferase family 2 protein [Nesterenkonia ebinurensis]|uniref:glycosyltransferase family 2 protein n=1 Tax=Nesterenkonia ebinurensis TaxID=2608252 RepID=UPI00123CF549|nr:glycosyltransferase family A protein [Nesterenkonia ebinurensis]